jgi:hypothetical protein
MSQSGPFDEEQLAELLAALPPAPEAWVRKAQALAPREAGDEPRPEVAEAQRQRREDR